MTWELLFTGHPCSPNDRLHWRTRAKHMKTWRSTSRLRAKLMEIPGCMRIRVSAVIYRRNLGVADEDNDRSRLKPVIDGLVDAGVVPNDSRGQIEWGPVTEEHGPKGVKLVIEKVA